LIVNYEDKSTTILNDKFFLWRFGKKFIHWYKMIVEPCPKFYWLSIRLVRSI